MKDLKLLQPQSLPFDFNEWKKQPFATRVKMLCTAWATQGYGAPVSVYGFYAVKMALYVGLWLLFCSFSENLGPVSEISVWWSQPEALLKAVLWSMLFESLGLGCGSGPLTARYLPPLGGVLHFLRPGTIRLPLFPQWFVDKRTLLDVALFSMHIGLLIRLLVAPHISPMLLLPSLILLPLMGLFDRTIFLAARAEHYFVAGICFLFPEEALAGSKVIWIAIWFWAATSKLNKHFPSVICVMISNSAVIQSQWLRKKIYKNYPEDLRPGKIPIFLAYVGTVVEYLFPLLLLFGDGGTTTIVGLVLMILFHVFITSSVPMGVPIEWNVLMVYGAFVLFGPHAGVSVTEVAHPLLLFTLFLFLVLLPIVGNFFPKWISFLLSMRYYAGNWAYSVWLFRDNAQEKMDEHIPKSSQTLLRQLDHFYDRNISESLLARVISFRTMHLQGRLLSQLVPKAVNDIDRFTWRDGELVAGVALGWNFGDGHLHHEALLNAIQKRCDFQPGELRCMFVESEAMGSGCLEWRIVDAADGVVESGKTAVKELLEIQPWGIKSGGTYSK